MPYRNRLERLLVRAKSKPVLGSRRCRPRSAARLVVELLETRTAPAVTDWAAQVTLVSQSPFNDVLEAQGSPQHGAQALSLQPVQVSYAALPVSAALVTGNISAGSADVNWYSFTLVNAATVTLTTFDQPGSSLASVLSLYNTHHDAVFDNSLASGGFMPAPNDPLDPLGHRLLAQVQGSAAGGTSLLRNLAAGTYYVAVSGAGNRSFHPNLA